MCGCRCRKVTPVALSNVSLTCSQSHRPLLHRSLFELVPARCGRRAFDVTYRGGRPHNWNLLRDRALEQLYCGDDKVMPARHHATTSVKEHPPGGC